MVQHGILLDKKSIFYSKTPRQRLGKYCVVSPPPRKIVKSDECLIKNYFGKFKYLTQILFSHNYFSLNKNISKIYVDNICKKEFI